MTTRVTAGRREHREIERTCRNEPVGQKQLTVEVLPVEVRSFPRLCWYWRMMISGCLGGGFTVYFLPNFGLQS